MSPLYTSHWWIIGAQDKFKLAPEVFHDAGELIVSLCPQPLLTLFLCSSEACSLPTHILAGFHALSRHLPDAAGGLIGQERDGVVCASAPRTE